MKKVVFLCLIGIFTYQASYAQNEIARERASLRGLQELGIVVNVEKSIGLSHESLNTGLIRKAIIENFEGLPLTILSDRTLRQSDEFPILHVHINIMRASNQTYPFSIEMNFYQPVKLVLNRDLQTMASTWNKGQVGVVSENMMHIIAAEAVNATNLFKDEFEEVN
ncbi:MAG: hypothetical protein JJ971_05565 [Balneolaceae bacterium]|nr:hypothetical protein [Balneolaceae bacterium]MBO6545845.1 hypothetical protein [Balneolaceae bacterium]MBO6647241.1 hypothetical protein [Balneolaceae bacterium]